MKPIRLVYAAIICVSLVLITLYAYNGRRSFCWPAASSGLGEPESSVHGEEDDRR